MKRKPSWALWLLMIVAPIAVFVGINFWKPLPPPLTPLDQHVAELAARGKPLIGDLRLRRVEGQPNLYNVDIAFCNPTAEKLSLDFAVKSGASELFECAQGVSLNYRDWGNYAKCSLGNFAGSFIITEIKQVRKKPIHFKITWKHGSESGVRNVVITPQMKP